VRNRPGDADEPDLHAPAHDIDLRPSALIGDVTHARRGQILEQFGEHVLGRADARGGVVDLPGARFGEADELLHRPRRQGRMHHQHVGRDAERITSVKSSTGRNPRFL
jgi:hypothetical protein